MYYSSLCQYLEKLGGDAKAQCPFEIMLEQLKIFGKYGLILAICVVPIVCTPKDELFDKGKLDGNAEEIHKEMQLSEETEINYKTRMNGVISDLIKLEYI